MALEYDVFVLVDYPTWEEVSGNKQDLLKKRKGNQKVYRARLTNLKEVPGLSRERRD